jgi:hypothetical protein
MLDDLNNMPDKPPFIQVMGKAAAMTIPIAMFLGATLAPELAIGMMLGDNLGIVLTNAVVAQFWSMLANKAMDERDIKNPLTRLGVDMLIGTASTSGALDIRGIYRLGFNRSANLAKEMSKNLANSVPDTLPEGTKQVIFVSHNISDKKGIWGKRYVNNLNRNKDILFSKESVGNHFVPALRTDDFYLSPALFMGNAFIIPVIQISLLNFFKRGYNPDGLKTAALALAYKAKHPDVDISFLGTCGGGSVVKEANEILKAAGVNSKKNLTAGTANFGIINSKEYENFISSKEKWYIKLFYGRNNYNIEFVTDHTKYFGDPFFDYVMVKRMNGHDISDDIKEGQVYIKIKDSIDKDINKLTKDVKDKIQKHDFLKPVEELVDLEKKITKETDGGSDIVKHYIEKIMVDRIDLVLEKYISNLDGGYKDLYVKISKEKNIDTFNSSGGLTKKKLESMTNDLYGLKQELLALSDSNTKNSVIKILDDHIRSFNAYQLTF